MHLAYSTLILIFIAVTAIGVLIQAGVLLGMYIASRHAEKRVMEKVDDIRRDIAPLLSSVHQLVEETTPKIRAVTEHVHAVTTHVHRATEQIHAQIEESNFAVAEILDLARAQALRVDGMVTEALDTVADGTRLVQESIMLPLRQVGGWISAAKAMVDALRRPEKNPSDRTTATSASDRYSAERSYSERRTKVYDESM